MDINILYFLESIRLPYLNEFLALITHLGDHGFIWILFSIICLFHRKTRLLGVFMILALLSMQLIGNMTIKPLVARPRPFITYENLNIIISKPSSYSFPSGHTYSSFVAFFVVLFSSDLGIKIPSFVKISVFTLASLISFSRLYFAVHYPSDVVVAIILAYITTFIILKILEINLQKINYFLNNFSMFLNSFFKKIKK